MQTKDFGVRRVLAHMAPIETLMLSLLRFRMRTQRYLAENLSLYVDALEHRRFGGAYQRRSLLHDGSARTLEHLLGLEGAPPQGHAFLLDVDEASRRAIGDWLWAN